MDKRLREALARYVDDLFAGEDEVLTELRREIAESGLPEIYINAQEGKLLQVLLRAVGAETVVEFGTLGGYSAIWMARALPAGGRLITVERESDRASLAERYLQRAGLGDRVEVQVGEALELLDGLAATGPFDVAFIDADKENYPVYLDWCLRNVRSGGLIVGDNAFKDGRVLEEDSSNPEVKGIQEFNRRIASDRRLTSIVVPTRDGVAIAFVN